MDLSASAIINDSSTNIMQMKPANLHELQLFKVLQKANLLEYFPTFVALGGDDLQQFYEATEDEFLEILALVGMTKKPLHVRRFQKALNDEWLSSAPSNNITTNNMDSAPPSDNESSPTPPLERAVALLAKKLSAATES